MRNRWLSNLSGKQNTWIARLTHWHNSVVFWLNDVPSKIFVHSNFLLRTLALQSVSNDHSLYALRNECSAHVENKYIDWVWPSGKLSSKGRYVYKSHLMSIFFRKFRDHCNCITVVCQSSAVKSDDVCWARILTEPCASLIHSVKLLKNSISQMYLRYFALIS